jgi:hypothetical protein
MTKPPVVSVDEDGRFSITITPKCSISWWCERHDDQEHWYVSLKLPKGIPIVPLTNGALIVKPATH